MIVTFRSKSAADIIMLSQHAEPLLQLLGKKMRTELGLRGHIRAEELPEYILLLEKACQEDAAKSAMHDEEDEEENHSFIGTIHIGLKQRAYPLLDMMKHAFANSEGISWE